MKVQHRKILANMEQWPMALTAEKKQQQKTATIFTHLFARSLLFHCYFPFSRIKLKQ